MWAGADGSWSRADASWSCDEGPGRVQTQAGRATIGPGRMQTGPKSHKTLEGHISLTTCPNRAFEVFFGIYWKCRFQESPQTPDLAKF